MSKVIDIRLRKIEKVMKSDALDHLSEEQLMNMIRSNLEHVVAPYNGDLIALRESLGSSSDHKDHELAKYVDHIIENFREFYPEVAAH